MPTPYSRDPADTGYGPKLALRDQLLTARGRIGLAERAERAREIARHVLSAPELRVAGTVAAYVATGREPGTGPLLDGLLETGRRVLLPVVLPDLDLDWAAYAGSDSLAPAPRGLLEPVGPALGSEAVAGADVVLVPGLAVDRGGNRLGRGGGSYDRALGRIPVGTPVWVLLHSEEVLDAVPTEAHDRRVTGAVTEHGVLRFDVTRFGRG